MKKLLFLHVGLHKTGTSTIQKFIGINKERLMKEKIFVPGVLDRENLHHYIALKLKKDVDISMARERFRNTISNIADMADKVIISSEVFTEENLIYIDGLSELNAFFDVNVIIYLRRGDYMLESAYNQIIKRTTEYQQFHQRRWYNLFYTKHIFPFEKMFGLNKIMVRVFEKDQFVENSIIKDFLTCTDIDKNLELQYPVDRINSKLTLDVLEYKRLLNTVLSKKEGSKLVADIVTMYSNEHEKLYPNDQFNSILTPFERINLLKELESEYNYIAKKYLNREDGILFYEKPPRIDQELSKFEELRLDKAIEITKYLYDKEPNLSRDLIKRLYANTDSESKIHRDASRILIPAFEQIIGNNSFGEINGVKF